MGSLLLCDGSNLYGRERPTLPFAPSNANSPELAALKADERAKVDAEFYIRLQKT